MGSVSNVQLGEIFLRGDSVHAVTCTEQENVKVQLELEHFPAVMCWLKLALLFHVLVCFSEMVVSLFQSFEPFQEQRIVLILIIHLPYLNAMAAEA